MCGIVGYVGEGHAKERIIDGLKRLEYRGYDSAGIALPINGRIEIRKHVGEIKNLEKIIGDPAYDSSVGIGHTRWATHGAPSDLNAHPHANGDNSIAIVHNGIIENYQEIKEWLIRDYGVKFKSETDSEVIAHLIGIYYDGDLLQAVNRAVEQMRGAYAVAAIAAAEPDKIVAVRKDAPLVAGIGKGFNFIASDIPALLKYVREVYLIENNETVVLTKDDIKIYNEDGKVVKRDVFHVTWDADAAEKEGYEHFMLKEIHEQPKGIQETLVRRLNEDGTINLDGISMTKEDIENFDKVYIVACGTAYHAGLVGKLVIEKMARVPVEVDIASEFRYRDPFVDEKTLFIAISQSGETLDTLAALREAKRKGARILSVVNVVGSSVARESDDVFYTWAGPEIAVASTKAYTTQLVSLLMLALYMGQVKESISLELVKKLTAALLELPKQIEEVLTEKEHMSEVADRLIKAEDIFYLGRSIDYAIAMEGALKLKEVSYIHAEAYAAGELKHGTLALISAETPVIAVATQNNVRAKMYSNIQEVRARGADVLGIGYDDDHELEKYTTGIVRIPKVDEFIAPILSVIPMQLLAYYTGIKRGNDVDKPRNLAKSVTVE